MKAHKMLPVSNHDEKARQDFVASLRKHLAGRVMPGNGQVYKARVEPAFREKHQRSPETVREVREWMTRDPYYQFWSAMQRRSQEMMWDSLIDPVERQLDQLIGKYRDISRKAESGGSLQLNPDMAIPRYHTAADIHIQPGAYHTEHTADDVAAGAIYEAGLEIYLAGAMGPEHDGLGRLLSSFFIEQFPGIQPQRILDMGCAVGNSTLPWHSAFPKAELYAIDVAAPCLRFAHARAELFGVPVHFSQQNAESTNFEDESFDLVVSHIMLHETSRTALANIFAECHRLLKPGGKMLHIEVPRGKEPFEQFMCQWETYNNNETFTAFMTVADLAGMAESAGFRKGKARMAGINAGFSEEQKNYNTGEFIWPVLLGEKEG
jgi:2-polyprenyl-3-methyl-5-hydroxy-6-metoxy-1,4-benzoquinol methylase